MMKTYYIQKLPNRQIVISIKELITKRKQVVKTVTKF